MNGDIEIIEQIRLLSTLSPAVPFVFYLRGFRQSPVQNHLIGSLIVFSICVDLITYLGVVFLPIHTIYNIIEFTIITLFFYELIYKNRLKGLMLVSIGIYLVALVYSISEYGLGRFSSGLISTASLILITHTLVYTFSAPKMTVKRYFDKNFYSNMIFNASMFGYFLILLTVTFLHSQVIITFNEPNVIKAFWSVHNVFNIVKNLGFAFAFYYTGKRHVYMTFEELERIAKKQVQERGEN